MYDTLHFETVAVNHGSTNDVLKTNCKTKLRYRVLMKYFYFVKVKQT